MSNWNEQSFPVSSYSTSYSGAISWEQLECRISGPPSRPHWIRISILTGSPNDSMYYSRPCQFGVGSSAINDEWDSGKESWDNCPQFIAVQPWTQNWNHCLKNIVSEIKVGQIVLSRNSRWVNKICNFWMAEPLSLVWQEGWSILWEKLYKWRPFCLSQI